MKFIGQTIRSLRREKGWSQEDVAGRLSISVPAYSKIENDLTDINLSRLEQVAEVFGMQVTELLLLEEPVHEQTKAYLAALDAELIHLQQSVIDLHERLRELDKAADLSGP